MTVSERPSVIVVGAGYGGLATAIELARVGIPVRVFEATKELTSQGDILQLASNATRVMSKWGNVLEQMRAESAIPKIMRCQNSAGETLIDQELPEECGGFPNVYTNRSRTQKIMYEYAVSLGIEFHFDSRVTDFFENENEAWVTVGDKKYTTDAVVVADGVHSRARKLITGKAEKPQSSGFAVYRSWFPLDVLKDDPLLEEIVNSKEDLFRVWIGPDTHAIVLTNTKLRYLVCFCTHKDTYAVEESWSFPGKVEDMLKVVDTWDEKLQAVVKKIPQDALIDYKLLWRDPAQKWVSTHGRFTLVGDSAHPHLATSGQGAAQAIEDGVTIAALLDLAGKSRLPTALRAFQKLRYYRTSLTQRMGWELRHTWHRTDWNLIKAQPDLLKMPQPSWLFELDARAYAYESFDAVMKAVESGEEFTPTNLPKGYVHHDWTIESMMELEKEQAKAYREARE